MDQIGINSNVSAGGKIFHIQTIGSLTGLTIQSEVYDAGRVIMVQKKKLDENRTEVINEEQFRQFLNTFHHEIVSEIKLLFFIRDKIRTIKHAISNNKMGLIFLRKGMVDEAISEFEHAIEKSPELVEAYNNLGSAYVQRGNFAEAINVLKKGKNLEPQFADLRNNLGIADSKAKMYAEALEEFQAALKINPNYTEVYLNIGTAYLESIFNEPESKNLPPAPIRKSRAIENFEKTMISNPDFTSYRFFSFRFEKAIKQINSDEIAPAIETIQEIKNAIQKPNLDETIHGFYLKFLFGGVGKDDKALNEYRIQLEKAVEENPQYADLHNSLGIIYLIQCRNIFLKAVNQFKKAYEINPSYKNAYKNFRLVQNDGREFLNLLRAILK